MGEVCGLSRCGYCEDELKIDYVTLTFLTQIPTSLTEIFEPFSSFVKLTASVDSK